MLFRGKPFKFQRRYGSYVMENVLFKISFPAEFHAQTAVEAAMQLHPEVKDRLDRIKKIEIVTHESAIRIIDKKGPLEQPGRPRPLHPVHGRDRPDQGQSHRRPTTRTTWRGTRASTRCAPR